MEYPMVKGLSAGILRPMVNLFRRYFTTLSSAASQFYEFGSDVVLTGDFEIELDYQTDDLTSTKIYALCGGGTNDFLRLHPTTSSFSVRYNGSVYNTTGTYTENTKLNTVKLALSGTTLKIYRNDVEVGSTTVTVTPWTVSVVGQRAALNYFDGIISNIQITDGSALVVDMPLDENFGNTTIARNRSAVLGSELVANGDFTTDTVWTKGTGWGISGGAGSCDGTQTSSSKLEQLTVEIGKTYLISASVTSRTAGTIRLFAGGGSVTAWSAVEGVRTFILTASGTYAGFEADLNFVGSVDNISIKEIPAATPYAAADQISESELFTFDSEYGWLGGERVPLPLNFSAEWLNATGATINITSNTFESSSTGGQGVYKDLSLGAGSFHLSYGITSDDSNWQIKDSVGGFGADPSIVVAASSAEIGRINYTSVNGGIYLRHDLTANKVVTANQLSVKKLIEVAA